MDTKGAAWKQIEVAHDAARQAAFDAKKAAVEAAVARFDKNRVAEPTSLSARAHRLEYLIDILALDMAEARAAFTAATCTAWTARKEAHTVFWEKEAEEKREIASEG